MGPGPGRTELPPLPGEGEGQPLPLCPWLDRVDASALLNSVKAEERLIGKTGSRDGRTLQISRGCPRPPAKPWPGEPVVFARRGDRPPYRWEGLGDRGDPVPPLLPPPAPGYRGPNSAAGLLRRSLCGASKSNHPRGDSHGGKERDRIPGAQAKASIGGA